MEFQASIPRTRGSVCGVLLILLGLWGGLAPFAGPYYHFGFTPDKAWAYTSGRLYYSAIPAGAALLGGLLLLATRNRGVGVVGGVLAALGGAWLVLGQPFVTAVLKKTAISAGSPLPAAGALGAGPLRAYLEATALFGGLGVIILFVAALAVGRFSMVSAKDLVAEPAPDYHEFAPSQPAGPPDLDQYPAPSTSFPTVAGQFPSGSPSSSTGQFPRPRLADTPPQYPDNTTAQLPQRPAGLGDEGQL